MNRRELHAPVEPRRRSRLFCLLLLMAGCGTNPSAPSAFDLQFGQPSLELARGELATVPVLWQQAAGVLRDVSDVAGWHTSNPAVASVERGRIQAGIPGDAVITASYRGQSAALELSVRRRTRLVGSVTLRYETFPGYFAGIKRLEAHVDAEVAGRTPDFAPEVEVLTVSIGEIPGTAGVAPGVHVVGVRPTLYGTNPATLLTDPGFLQIVDADTGEYLRTLSLPERRGAYRTGDSLEWTIQVDRLK
jgi:hypothetical protein